MIPSRSESSQVTLPCGELGLFIERTEWPLADLCGFASRRNRKRGFLFVSKVLGKHYPVRPARMRAIQRYLAEQLGDIPDPVLVIAMAETAVALGQGVFECLTARGKHDGLFLPTTRYRSARPLALSFQESHSHATDHFLYLPEGAAAQAIFAQARSLVVVDDEFSSGNTLANLMAAYGAVNPTVQELRAVSITDWLGPPRRLALAERFAPKNLQYINVLQGEFSFRPNPTFDCGEPVNVHGNDERKDHALAQNFGRWGLNRPVALDYADLLQKIALQPHERILMLGTGEFMYPPFLLAEWLEAQGYDVHFQSTTRSPILLGNDIATVVETQDNYGDGIPNYVYNVSPEQYDRIVIGYETPNRPVGHDLPEQLGATIVEFT